MTGLFGRQAKTAVAVCLMAFMAVPMLAFSQELQKVPRPKANPSYLAAAVSAPMAEVAAATPTPAAAQMPRPKHRPAVLEAKAVAVRAVAADPALGIDLASLRPKARPEALLAMAAEPQPRVKEKRQDKRQETKRQPQISAKGSVCGVAAIKGQTIAPITSKVKGCGLSDGVRVTSVSGVRLSMAITVDCATAKALNTWVERAAQPAYGNRIVELKIAGHYVCRPRNNKKGGKVSEHGRGKAVDISGITLNDGKTRPVLRGFDRTMRQAYKGACGIFGTTLGPGSDGYHEDHLHFDTAAHRRGAYCR